MLFVINIGIIQTIFQGFLVFIAGREFPLHLPIVSVVSD